MENATLHKAHNVFAGVIHEVRNVGKRVLSPTWSMMWWTADFQSRKLNRNINSRNSQLWVLRPSLHRPATCSLRTSVLHAATGRATHLMG